MTVLVLTFEFKDHFFILKVDIMCSSLKITSLSLKLMQYVPCYVTLKNLYRCNDNMFHFIDS